MMAAAPDGMKQKMARDGLRVPGAGALGKDGQRLAQDVPSAEISPRPGFVIKTKMLTEAIGRCS